MPKGAGGRVSQKATCSSIQYAELARFLLAGRAGQLARFLLGLARWYYFA